MAREYDKTHYRKLREKVLIRDAYTCYYCGQEANTVDHIIPMSKGGMSSDENMIAACTRCNSSKLIQRIKQTIAKNIDSSNICLIC